MTIPISPDRFAIVDHISLAPHVVRRYKSGVNMGICRFSMTSLFIVQMVKLNDSQRVAHRDDRLEPLDRTPRFNGREMGRECKEQNRMGKRDERRGEGKKRKGMGWERGREGKWKERMRRVSK
jgi:hypothetical protein